MEPTSDIVTLEGRASPLARTPAPRRKIPSKPKVLARSTLDGRTSAARHFDLIVSRMTEELGGHLSTRQEHLVEAFAACCINLDALNARMLVGEDIDQIIFNNAIATMMQLDQRIGSTTNGRAEP